ncbi:glycoside hydrolase family 92 protein, partial [Bacteroides xylanisolvens]
VGEFFTTERFWGGPDSIKISFVLDCNRPIKSIDGWNEKGVLPDVEAIAGNAAGMVLNFGQLNAEELLFKMALSYTSVDNAIANMDAELNHWDFDKVCKETRSIWNEALGRIAVEGGTDTQRIKFYTDLWHVLLGRHKINDVNGYYPDYAGNKYVNKRTSEPMKVRRLPLTADGKPKFNMYGFDGLWLTHWNLNVLWGLAWPEVMDDLSACLVQYADNGKLLPRGACSGGYSFIMIGCPATSLLVSTYMKGIMKKADPLHTLDVIKRNHMPGGMMSYESADDLKFYISHGYCPDNASKTLEWAFQDWGASRMAARLGKRSEARMFEKRSRAWTPLFNAEQGLVFPKKRNGEWLHQDGLSGSGWVEANSWQATWSLSHELPKLVKMMGGADKFCEKLNFAFEQAKDLDFVYAYSGGYVSYANQPGCSNAHVFTYGGKPWLTQYWVRQVKERAYGGITPDKGYGGHDEDEGQMGGVSALMALGLFSVTGTESDTPYYDITSPIFDKITIKLNKNYYEGSTFTITTHNNSAENCYIQRAQLNNVEWNYAQFDHADFAKGGKLELWLGNQPNKSWGKLKYLAPDSDL